jgi:hypothetical protein
MEAQLGLLQQQMEIERSVHAAMSGFLDSKAGQLQDDAGGWHSRREEDGRTKEQALEVSGYAALLMLFATWQHLQQCYVCAHLECMDDAGGLHSRGEEDGRTKERALEVGGHAALGSFAALSWVCTLYMLGHAGGWYTAGVRRTGAPRSEHLRSVAM